MFQWAVVMLLLPEITAIFTQCVLVLARAVQHTKHTLQELEVDISGLLYSLPMQLSCIQLNVLCRLGRARCVGKPHVMYSSAYSMTLMMRRPRCPKARSPMSGYVRIQGASAMHRPSSFPVYRNSRPVTRQAAHLGR